MAENTEFATETEPLRQRNSLLRNLPQTEFTRISALLKPVELHIRDCVAERNQLASHVYFPCSGVLSVLNYMADGKAVEIGTVGSEGFAGVEVLSGADVALHTIICQVGGAALRMAIPDFRESIARETALRRLANCYLMIYLSQMSQSVACNRLHSIEQRFARWLLMTQDRVHRESFYITHEFLADMLGSQRPSVSVVANYFQQAGLIHYHRGTVVITDRIGLEQAACECYSVERTQLGRLMQLA